MRVSLKWLRDYVDFDLPPEELAHRLTMAGLEVTAIHRTGGWESVLVGQVVALEQHPNADRLKLATVDLGGERLTVVCGAPNVAAGQRIAFARVGARLFDPDSGRLETLKAARIRGVRSEGMVCSERELGLGQDHTGILVLPSDAPPGLPLDDYLGDVVLDTEVTPNRPDWLSMIGVAWEVAALTGGTARMPDTSYPEVGSPIADLRPVEVLAPDLTLRYTASLVTRLTVGPAPGWMQLRLQAAGLRPISNVVDITNYVMLELGQPLHAFDYDSLRGRGVIVRRARPGEPLTTLDGRTHELTTDDLVIADTEVPVGLAGVMGGAESEVSPLTHAVLLESATFNQVAIRRTVQRHRIEVGGKRGTEASQRFEKGLPPDLAPVALRRATKLLVEFGGGAAARGIVDAYPEPLLRQPVRLTSRRLAAVLGVDPGRERVSVTLASLGFEVHPARPEPALGQSPERSEAAAGGPVGGRTGYALDVTPPFWRTDVSIPEDLAEEVARITGYDAIPTTLPRPAPAGPGESRDPLRDLKEAARDVLAGLGMQEVITYALVGKDLLERTVPSGSPAPLRAWNPMSPQQEYLRTTLRGGLLRAFTANERTAQGGLRLFEMGRVYLPRPGDLPEERETVAGVLGGPRRSRHWRDGPDEAEAPSTRSGQAMDFFDAKGIVEALLTRLGIPAAFEAAEDRALVPGRTARVLSNGQPIGLVGEVHPDLLVALDIRTPAVVLFEIDLPAALPHRLGARGYRPVSRYPGVVRDLALVVDESTPAGHVEGIIRDFPAVAQAALVDVYTGPQVDEGRKSLAFRVVWQSPTRTLTDREVEIAQAQLLEALERGTGARLRG